MSAVLLFCTAQVPGQLINKLMQDCTLPDPDSDSDPDPDPDFAVNFFSLVRTPDQPDVDGFTTGFLGKADAELRQFPAERIPRCNMSRLLIRAGLLFWMSGL